MSKLSNNQGRGYEYICLHTLCSEIGKVRPVQIDKNSSYLSAQHAWNTLSAEEQQTYTTSAKAAVKSVFDLEPLMIEQGTDVVELYIQADTKGKEGDVRDIIVQRSDISWEIGFSIKHNHFAVKHSRLSPTIDFGKIWFGSPCSEAYWAVVKPVFDYLKEEKSKGTYFRNIPDKEQNVYVPIVQAFIDEIQRQYKVHKDIPAKMVEYLLSRYDFYKIISIDTQRLTQIQSYNLHGTLNKAARAVKPAIQVPITALPSRIVSIGFVPNRHSTAELYMDGGWQFTFRIHNAEDIATPSLKFDIQIVGMPTTVITINCLWN